MSPEATTADVEIEPTRRLHPVVAIGLSQAVAVSIVVGSGWLLMGAEWIESPLRSGLPIACGLLAAVIGLPLGLRRGWLVLQAVLPAAVDQAMRLDLPAWVYLALFALLLLVFRNSAIGRVPLYLTNRRTHAALAGLLPDRPLSFIDLGCGLGGVVMRLGRIRPDGRFLGVESAPLPFVASWLRRRLFGTANTTIVYGDFWNRSLTPYDAVYCFLSPVPMAALYRKAKAEMKPGSLLISNSFVVPDVPADRVIEVDDGRCTRLNVWEFGSSL